ncbi:MAG: DNA-binding protein [Verrucomicrobia bacterium]|nr:DNA-binding protein [Verrucomicrobiota bacterium]
MKKSLLAGGLILALACMRGIAASPGGESAPASPAKADGIAGKVVETMTAASYTYVLVDTGGKKVWAAAPQFAVKAGDAVAVAEVMPMTNYHSKTLNRTFEVVYFSGNVMVNGTRSVPAGAAAELPKDHPTTAGAARPAAPDLSGIKRAANGQTVAEIHAGKAKFAGKPIAVRGRVVKYNAMILGKNWLHIRDGSGADGTNDLTVTTATNARLGDLVLVTGVLASDRDFGGGYKYTLIVEDATVVVE